MREGNTSWLATAMVAIEADTSAGAHSASSSDIVGGFATQQVYFNPGETHKTFECQSALNWDPRSARKRDPLVRCVEGAFRRGS